MGELSKGMNECVVILWSTLVERFLKVVKLTLASYRWVCLKREGMGEKERFETFPARGFVKRKKEGHHLS